MAIVLALLAVTIAGVVAAAVAARLHLGSAVHFALFLIPVASSLLLALLVVSSYRSYRRELAEHGRKGELAAGLFDPETGTFGPRYVEFAFHHEMALANRSQAPLTLISASFDYDRTLTSHGLEAATHLVHVTAQILRTALRGSDIICHYNHGEFVVLLPETDVGQAEIPRRRIMRAVDEWNSSTRTRYRLSLKVGAADAWDGLAQSLRDARLASSLVAPPPPFTVVGYVARSSAIN
jgi:diguanylate cyclase (GGDEF)-like protein